MLFYVCTESSGTKIIEAQKSGQPDAMEDAVLTREYAGSVEELANVLQVLRTRYQDEALCICVLTIRGDPAIELTEETYDEDLVIPASDSLPAVETLAERYGEAVQEFYAPFED